MATETAPQGADLGRVCALSVDLDEIPNYFRIHGLPPAPESASTAVYDVALGRLLLFASTERIPITFFAIGADLARPEAARALRGAHAMGHEIANHTLDHRYDFTRLSRSEIVEQIEGGERAIAEAIGEGPVGFRAPGYTITDEVFEILAERRYAYDSSVFPCPPYYTAKALVMGLMRLRGRRSRSILDSPRVLFSPRRPYRVGRPYHRRGSGLLELPIQVTRGPRLHFIGTTITLAGPSGARLLARMCIGEPFINLELHGIDVLDSADGLSALAPHQPDVRVPLARKLESLHAVVDVLREAGYRFVAMKDVARRFG